MRGKHLKEEQEEEEEEVWGKMEGDNEDDIQSKDVGVKESRSPAELRMSEVPGCESNGCSFKC